MKNKLTITKNKDNNCWYYEYMINIDGKYEGFIGKIFKDSEYLNVCSQRFNINTCWTFKTIKEVRKYIQGELQ